LTVIGGHILSALLGVMDGKGLFLGT
jgi:hypothetical protein